MWHVHHLGSERLQSQNAPPLGGLSLKVVSSRAAEDLQLEQNQQ